VREGTDISADTDGNVHPNSGGTSVRPSLDSIPLRFLPARLNDSGRAPGAFGSNALRIWKLGEGAFAADRMADRLTLRPDPDDSQHGFLEPDAIMKMEAYKAAIAATRDGWQNDES